MADHYTKTSFVLEADPRDVAFLREVTDLDLSLVPDIEWREQFENRSARFKNAFPGSDADPFEAYRSLFSDPGYPIPGFEISGRNDRRRAATHCRQRRPDRPGNSGQHRAGHVPERPTDGVLLCLRIQQARPDEFGGGFVLITDDAVVFRGTQEGLHSALKQLEDEDARSLVLATRDPEHGLSFWNKETGFGRLADATVFTPSEAEKADPVIAADEPEWTTMPRWPQ